MAQIRIICGIGDYDQLMDSIVGTLVMCGYHISNINEKPTDKLAGTRRAYISVVDGGPQDCGQCGNVQVVRI